MSTRDFRNNDFRMLSRPEYFALLAKELLPLGKGDRAVVTTMGFSPNMAEIKPIAEAMKTAAKNGATVSLLMDAFDFLINADTKVPGPLWLSPKFHLDRRMREPFRTRLAELKAFAEHGGTHTVTNQPGKAFVWPFSGRSHIKAVVINDTVYMGGCNLNNPHELDIQLRWRDPETADWLYNTLMRFEKIGSVRQALEDTDQTRKLDNKTTLFIDAGVPDQSIIFDEALRMIDEAQEWLVLTSQYFAPGLGTQALARALKRGVKITYYYSHYSMHGPIESTLHRVAQWRERRRLPLALFERRLPIGQHLHAKILATEKGTLIGSHNYGDFGVHVGTAEIALKRTDVAFGKKAVEFIEKQINE